MILCFNLDYDLIMISVLLIFNKTYLLIYNYYYYYYKLAMDEANVKKSLKNKLEVEIMRVLTTKGSIKRCTVQLNECEINFIKSNYNLNYNRFTYQSKIIQDFELNSYERYYLNATKVKINALTFGIKLKKLRQLKVYDRFLKIKIYETNFFDDKISLKFQISKTILNTNERKNATIIIDDLLNE